MAIILDADVIIRGERGQFDLVGWLTSVDPEPLAMAAITVAELWHGVERADVSHRSRRETYLRTLLNSIPIIPYTEETAYHHARIWAQLESSGKMISPYDLIVAATVIERDGRLATFNKRHFSNVTELKIIDLK